VLYSISGEKNNIRSTDILYSFKCGDTLTVKVKKNIADAVVMTYENSSIILSQSSLIHHINKFEKVKLETRRYFRDIFKNINTVKIDLKEVVGEKVAKNLLNTLLLESLLVGEVKVVYNGETQEYIKVIKNVITLPGNGNKIIGKNIYAQFKTIEGDIIIECFIEHIDVFGKN
jgi:hypothetical protein